jgi:hypothetical protein
VGFGSWPGIGLYEADQDQGQDGTDGDQASPVHHLDVDYSFHFPLLSLLVQVGRFGFMAEYEAGGRFVSSKK